MLHKFFSMQYKSLHQFIFFHRLYVKFIAIILGLIVAFTALIAPYFQKKFVDGLYHFNQNNLSIIVMYIVYAFLFNFLTQIMSFFTKKMCFIEGSYFQKIISERIYKKIMNLNYESDKFVTVGHAINIYATDVIASSAWIDDILPNFSTYVFSIIITPIVIYFYIPINPFPVFICLLSLLFINSIMGIRQGRFFVLAKKYSSDRIAIVNEWLQHMKIIRVLGLTNFFDKKIKEKREIETNNRIGMVTNGSTMNAIGYSAPFFINVLGVLLLINVQGNNLSPGDVFSLLWIFGVVLLRPIRMIPMMLVTIGDCYTSTRRVEKFLNLKEEENCSDLKVKPENTRVNYALKFENVNVELSSEHCLKNINLSIAKQELIAVVGSVGSGKTTLLKSILGFYPHTSGRISIFDHSVNHLSLEKRREFFSYVPQDMFIINSTLRNNITLTYTDHKKDDEKIYESFSQAQFELDKENFEHGIDTEIGERGVNLSGGQKQRLAIARAYFHNKPIILLDDCMSAIDVNTEKKLFNDLILKEWNDKTVILVTHRLSILSKCDRIIFMENGAISAFDSYKNLIKDNQFFKRFLTSEFIV